MVNDLPLEAGEEKLAFSHPGDWSTALGLQRSLG